MTETPRSPEVVTEAAIDRAIDAAARALVMRAGHGVDLRARVRERIAATPARRAPWLFSWRAGVLGVAASAAVALAIAVTLPRRAPVDIVARGPASSAPAVADAPRAAATVSATPDTSARVVRAARPPLPPPVRTIEPLAASTGIQPAALAAPLLDVTTIAVSPLVMRPLGEAAAGGR